MLEDSWVKLAVLGVNPTVMLKLVATNTENNHAYIF